MPRDISGSLESFIVGQQVDEVTHRAALRAVEIDSRHGATVEEMRDVLEMLGYTAELHEEYRVKEVYRKTGTE